MRACVRVATEGRRASKQTPCWLVVVSEHRSFDLVAVWTYGCGDEGRYLFKKHIVNSYSYSWDENLWYTHDRQVREHKKQKKLPYQNKRKDNGNGQCCMNSDDNEIDERMTHHLFYLLDPVIALSVLERGSVRCFALQCFDGSLAMLPEGLSVGARLCSIRYLCSIP